MSPTSRNVAPMAGGNDYGIPYHPERYQDVQNSSWPPADVVRELKNRDDAATVQVRIVFSVDGEQWVDGIAQRWWQRHVCVEVDDPRLRVRYVWVDAGDVRRLSTAR
jgi:hypothetical protein